MKAPVLICMLLALPAFAAAQETPSSSVAGKSNEPATISIYDLIERVAKKTGKRFVIDPRVNGTVLLSGLDLNRVDYETLLAILRLHAFIAFTQDGLVNVMPDAGARQFPTPTLTADDPKIGSEEMMTRLVRMENTCATWLVPILRPMMPQFAHLAAYPPANTLIVADRAVNARRIADLAMRLDKQSPKQSCGDPAGKQPGS